MGSAGAGVGRGSSARSGGGRSAGSPRGAGGFSDGGSGRPPELLRAKRPNGKTKAGASGGGPVGAGERNTVREGKEKSFAGAELSS